MATRTRPRRDTLLSAGDGVPGSEYLYLLLLFPVVSVLFRLDFYHPAILLVAGMIVFRAVYSSDVRVSRSFVVVLSLYVVFLLYIATSMTWSTSSDYATFKFVRIASVCTLLIVAPAMLFPNERSVFRMFKLSIYVSVLLAVVIILGYLSPHYSRSFHLLGSKSHLASGRLLGFGIVVTTYYVLTSERTPESYSHGLMLGILLFGITVSESRGPMVAAAIAASLLVVLVLYFERADSRRLYQFIIISVLGGVSLFVLVVMFDISIPNVDRIIPLLRGDLDPSNVRRLDLYQNGVLLWLESPIVGSGLGSFGVWYHGTDIREFPHNFVLEILAELGVVGLLIFGALLCCAFRPLVANYRDHPIAILLFCLLVYALLNASFSEDLQGDRMVYALVGLSTCVRLFSGTDISSLQTVGSVDRLRDR